MELSERWIQTFEKEGFSSVFEHQDVPGTVYEKRCNRSSVSLFVTDGSIMFDFLGERKEARAGQRFDIPVGVPYSAVVGSQGWIGIIAEMVEGDFLVV
jgi:hypothetical protein